jgi:hypothetical protein
MHYPLMGKMRQPFKAGLTIMPNIFNVLILVLLLILDKS